ncbi:MAG: transglycosylase [Ferrovum sp.]|nr:transglycosylase [Ferrovum sp.]
MGRALKYTTLAQWGLLSLFLSACATSVPPKPPVFRTYNCSCNNLPPPVPTAPLVNVTPRGYYQSISYADLPSWPMGLSPNSWQSFLASCSKLINQPEWNTPCTNALQQPMSITLATQQAFFEAYLQPWQLTNEDRNPDGLITGYYEPLLYGSLTRTQKYQYPIYSQPQDIVTVDLGEVVPELKGRRIRGRLEGNEVKPYYSRSEIEGDKQPLKGHEIAWVDNEIDLFYLQIQGSGRILLDNGQIMYVGYADQNGHPFRSIALALHSQYHIPLNQTSYHHVKAWAEKHPKAVRKLLAENPSYVFFKREPDNLAGPIGTLGVPLLPSSAIAVDQRVIPLGVPVFLSSTLPLSQEPWVQLVMAQDTGGAINGAVRADFFWGFGDEAEKMASATKQKGRLWVLYPKGITPPQPLSEHSGYN